MDINIPLRTILWISVLANGFLLTEAQEKCGGIPYADGTGREVFTWTHVWGIPF